MAVRSNDISSVIAFLRECYVDPNYVCTEVTGLPSVYNRQSLIMASNRCNIPIIKLLIAAKADVNIVVGVSCSPMWGALNANRSQINNSVQKQCIQLLIENKANVSMDQTRPGNYLHTAARAGLFHTIPMLIDCGLSVNEQNDYQKTSLHCILEIYHMCTGNNEEAEAENAVRCLIKAGSGVNVRDGTNQSALMYTQRNDLLRHTYVAMMIAAAATGTDVQKML
jgi:ankyrin repeat protein